MIAQHDIEEHEMGNRITLPIQFDTRWRGRLTMKIYGALGLIFIVCGFINFIWTGNFHWASIPGALLFIGIGAVGYLTLQGSTGHIDRAEILSKPDRYFGLKSPAPDNVFPLSAETVLCLRKFSLKAFGKWYNLSIKPAPQLPEVIIAQAHPAQREKFKALLALAAFLQRDLSLKADEKSNNDLRKYDDVYRADLDKL